MKPLLQKSLFAASLLFGLALLASPAFADGTGVGGGTGAREEALANLREKIGPSLVIGPSAVAPSIEQWCERLGVFMQDQLDEANTEIDFGRPANAYRILRDALELGGGSIVVQPTFTSPLTKRLIDRGLVIANSLEELASTNPALQNTRLMAMVAYFEFMLDTIRKLDRAYYVPYHYRYGRCVGGCGPEFDYAAFERRYLEYARRQILFLNGQFTLAAPPESKIKVLPVGDAKVYLQLVPVISLQVASDVASTLSAYAQACSVIGLEELAGKVEYYNRHGVGYPTPGRAVNRIHGRLDRIAADLAHKDCRK